MKYSLLWMDYCATLEIGGSMVRKGVKYKTHEEAWVKFLNTVREAGLRPDVKCYQDHHEVVLNNGEVYKSNEPL